MDVPEFEVLIAGGGPVGLLLANQLGQLGVRTLVVERRAQPEVRSMAIGITPPSLAILRDVGLDAACVAHGARVSSAVVHDRYRPLGRLDFNNLPPPYPFILCLPQAETIRILTNGLSRFACITYLGGAELVGLQSHAEGVRASMHLPGGNGNGAITARYVVGCDGHASVVRGLAGIGTRHTPLGQTFRMADFDDDGSMPNEAHLFFTETGSVEAFPLPGHRRRWVVMTKGEAPADGDDLITRLVLARTGINLAGRRKHFESPFTVRQFLCTRYARGRVVLCGDAAHVMSPIGGQGMNTGFGDAAMLAPMLHAVLRQGAAAGPLLRRYDRVRRRAFKVAARRATRGMWLGTRTGTLASRLRSAFLSRLLLQPPLRDRLPLHFAMWTIPGVRV